MKTNWHRWTSISQIRRIPRPFLRDSFGILSGFFRDSFKMDDHFWLILTIHNHFHQFLDHSVPYETNFQPILTKFCPFPTNFDHLQPISNQFCVIQTNQIKLDPFRVDIAGHQSAKYDAFPGPSFGIFSGFFQDSLQRLCLPSMFIGWLAWWQFRSFTSVHFCLFFLFGFVSVCVHSNIRKFLVWFDD